MDRDKGRWVPAPREDGQVGGEPADGPLVPHQVQPEDTVQAYREVTLDEVLTGLHGAEIVERATWDPRRELAHDAVVQDLELTTGERFRIMVQRLR